MKISMQGPLVLELNGEPVLEVKEGEPVTFDQTSPIDLGRGIIIRSGVRDLHAEIDALVSSREEARAQAAKHAAELEDVRGKLEEERAARRAAEAKAVSADPAPRPGRAPG